MIVTRRLFMYLSQQSSFLCSVAQFGQKARTLQRERQECEHSTDTRELKDKALKLRLNSPTKVLNIEDKD